MSRFIDPVPLNVDLDVKPIVGAKTFFYEPGTSILKDILVIG